MSVDDVWTIWVCEDPECDDWSDLDGDRPCTNYRAHPPGGYPDMVPVDVVSVSRLHTMIGDVEEAVDNFYYDTELEDAASRVTADFVARLTALLGRYEGTAE